MNFVKFLSLLCLSQAPFIQSCKTRRAGDSAKESTVSSLDENQTQSNTLRLSQTVDSGVYSTYFYAEPSLGLAGIANSLEEFMQMGKGAYKYDLPIENDIKTLESSAAKNEVPKDLEEPNIGKPDTTFPTPKSTVPQIGKTSSAMSKLQTATELADLEAAASKNTTENDILVFSKSKLEDIKNDKIYFQKISSYKGYSKYRVIPRIQKDIAELRGYSSRVIHSDILKKLDLDDNSNNFLDVFAKSPDGVQFKTMTLGRLQVEHIEGSDGEFLVHEIPTDTDNWRVEFEYKDSLAGGKTLEQLYKSAYDTTPYRTRTSTDWINSLGKGIDFDVGVGGSKMRLNLQGGSGSIEILTHHPMSTVMANLRSSVYQGNKKQIQGSLTIKSRVSTFENKHWIDELIIENKNAPKGREDKVALLYYPSKAEDHNGAFNEPPEHLITSLACCYGKVHLVRLKDAEDIGTELAKVEDGSVSVLVIAGHGEPKNMELKTKGKNLSTTNMEEALGGMDIPKKLDPNANIYIQGCSLGSLETDENFVDAFSKLTPDHFVSGSFFSVYTDTFEHVASNDIKKGVGFNVKGLGTIPIVYRKHQKRSLAFEKTRETIHASLSANLKDPQSKFKYWDPTPDPVEPRGIVDFDASQIDKLAISIYRFPDYYTSGVLSLFAGRIWKANDGVHVINPNDQLAIFFSNNKIGGIKAIHFSKEIDNKPNTEIQLQDGQLVLDGLMLRYAIQNNSVKQVESLLDHEIKDPNGVLIGIAIDKGDPQMIEILLKRGLKDTNGMGLSHAIEKNNMEMVQIMLTYAPKDSLEPALNRASENGNFNAVSLLLDHGVKDSEGFALSAAIRSGKLEESLFQKFLANSEDPYGFALSAAVETDKKEFFDAMIKKGFKDPEGMALDDAKKSGNEHMIKALTELKNQ